MRTMLVPIVSLALIVSGCAAPTSEADPPSDVGVESSELTAAKAGLYGSYKTVAVRAEAYEPIWIHFSKSKCQAAIVDVEWMHTSHDAPVKEILAFEAVDVGTCTFVPKNKTSGVMRLTHLSGQAEPPPSEIYNFTYTVLPNGALHLTERTDSIGGETVEQPGEFTLAKSP